jgi:fumarate hydratase class I
LFSEDLAKEAIYEFEVRDYPVTVAVDSLGENVPTGAPLLSKKKIA